MNVAHLNLSHIVKRSAAAIFSAATAPLMFVSPASAGPGLYYYYDYLSLNTSECVNAGYQALENRSLRVPSNTIGDRTTFAIGEGDIVTVIVDCSEVSNSGRITVLASSQDPSIADSYAREIMGDIQR